MPPRCLPPDPAFGPDRDAERVTWEALHDQLPDDALLIHSLALSERGQDYEGDLIVALPGAGVAVIEVKGGTIARRDGAWQQSGRPLGDPVQQASDFKHVLQRYLAQRGQPAAKSRMAHLVAFPFTPVPAEWEAPGCPRHIVIAKGDLPAASTMVRLAIEEGVGYQTLDGEGLERLARILGGQLETQTTLLDLAELHEQRVDQMTREQARIIEVLRHQNRLKVTGGAGTGKTWLALEQARRLAKNGQRVALVCYSRGLARFLERTSETWPKNERPAYVGLFHALPLGWGAENPPPNDADREDATEYYERRLPAQMGELATALPPEGRFDSIIVDEAQDFGEAWWPPTLACLRDPAGGGLFAFLDEAQRVFQRSGEAPVPLPPFPLDENIRNTKRIAQVFGSLAAEQPRYRGIEGPPVRFVQCSTDDAVEHADAEIDRLVDEGWPVGSIALLTTGRRHIEQTSVIDHSDWAGYWDEFFAADSVFYGHVLGFKGLERPAIVLAVNGIRDLTRGREYLYVGLSRARTQLVVCGDIELIAQMGGPAVRKRLLNARVDGA
jgi:hypothetical protein